MSRLKVVRGWLTLLVVLTATTGLTGGPTVLAQDAPHESLAAAESHDPGIEQAEEADPMAISLDLAWATLVVFVLLFLVLKKFAWGPLAAALDAREKKIADHILAAEQAQEEAKKLLAEYEAKLAAAQEEVRAIIAEARRDAEHTQQEILAKAHADAQAEAGRAKREIETARDQALSELTNKSADLAVQLAGQILRKKLDAAEHAALVKDALQHSTSVARDN